MPKFIRNAGLLVPVIIILLISYELNANLSFVTVDEAEWVYWGKFFLKALESREWTNTYVSAISGHPGVTVLYLTAISYALNAVIPYLQVTILIKFFIFIIKALISLFPIMLLKKSFPRPVLFFATVYFLLNSNIMLGTESTWLDVLLTWFMFATVICWLKRLNGESKLWVFYTGVFIGLSLLTKYAAAILAPMLIMATIIGSKRVNVLRNLVNLSLAGLIGIAVFFIMYPAMWQKPLETASSRFTKSAQVTAKAGGSSFNNRLFFYPYNLLITDPVLIFAIIGLIVLSVDIAINNPSKYFATTNNTGFIFGICGLIYIICIVIISLTLVDNSNGYRAFFSKRYLYPSIPFLSLFFWDHIHSRISRYSFLIIFIGLILYQLVVRSPYFTLAVMP